MCVFISHSLVWNEVPALIRDCFSLFLIQMYVALLRIREKKIKTRLLGESTSNPTSLVTRQRAISIILDRINPLPSHNISTRRLRNKTLSVIVSQSLKLICHSCLPIWISKCTSRKRRGNMISSQIPITDRWNGIGLQTSLATKDRGWTRTAW